MSTGYDAMWDSVTDPGDDFWPPVITSPAVLSAAAAFPAHQDDRAGTPAA
jgi:hypothetical protein